MSEELKRCPFCGETDKVTIEWINPNGDEPCDIGDLFQLATCERCGLTMQQDYIKWEDRPIEDDLNAKIAQLTAELADWKADAERLIQLANFNNARAGEYFDLHEQLVKKYEVRE